MLPCVHAGISLNLFVYEVGRFLLLCQHYQCQQLLHSSDSVGSDFHV